MTAQEKYLYSVADNATVGFQEVDPNINRPTGEKELVTYDLTSGRLDGVINVSTTPMGKDEQGNNIPGATPVPGSNQYDAEVTISGNVAQRSWTETILEWLINRDRLLYFMS
ncbi:hypothetical protein [Paraflavitalea speifideaquila]|uniref:hypothetical protein n=1 Tax=Paraflavitalea speifideaquila TaxID=3076558 RepID=UPI0028EE3B13|nr:hypothetical protein [Paraflavitalea speifideiaquila]